MELINQTDVQGRPHSIWNSTMTTALSVPDSTTITAKPMGSGKPTTRMAPFGGEDTTTTAY